MGKFHSSTLHENNLIVEIQHNYFLLFVYTHFLNFIAPAPQKVLFL